MGPKQERGTANSEGTGARGVKRLSRAIFPGPTSTSRPNIGHPPSPSLPSVPPAVPSKWGRRCVVAPLRAPASWDYRTAFPSRGGEENRSPLPSLFREGSRCRGNIAEFEKSQVSFNPLTFLGVLSPMIEFTATLPGDKGFFCKEGLRSGPVQGADRPCRELSRRVSGRPAMGPFVEPWGSSWRARHRRGRGKT